MSEEAMNKERMDFLNKVYGEPKDDGLLTDEEIKTIVVGYSALENGTGWTEENLINIERVIAKTASIKDVRFKELCANCDSWLWKSSEKQELVDKCKAECQEKVEQTVKDDADRCAGYLKLAREECQQKVERIKGLALQAIADEPEFPGDMPDELWVELDGTRQQTTDIMRNTVRLTKEGIVGRLQALWKKEGGGK